ncbi:unnamed protein product [Soboliphyme baturini]|uniref:Uncharacterized protein n=1 Tax=Soboliphyme baturini TaxID=241478 RepID=A0A183J043_9BILA|nr:unnamed protein product [Soboliphyme baturini]
MLNASHNCGINPVYVHLVEERYTVPGTVQSQHHKRLQLSFADSGTGSGTLEALSDVPASATRKEKRRWKMKKMSITEGVPSSAPGKKRKIR